MGASRNKIVCTGPQEFLGVVSSLAGLCDGAHVSIAPEVLSTPDVSIEARPEGAHWPTIREGRTNRVIPMRATGSVPSPPIRIHEPAGREDAAPSHVPTVCFASARGGVGKSALASLCALALAQDGLDVALIDLDYQFGTCLGYLGAGETDGLIDIGDSNVEIHLDEHALARCRTECAPHLDGFEFCIIPEQAELLVGLTQELIRASSLNHDVAIIDLPCGLSEVVAQAIETSDRCVLVGDRRAFSLESLKSQQSLCVRIGVPRTKLITVINRCDIRHRDESFMSRAGFELQTPKIERVMEGGPEVTQMLSIGEAAELTTLRNRFALSAADFIHSICSDLGCLPRSIMHKASVAQTPSKTYSKLFKRKA